MIGLHGKKGAGKDTVGEYLVSEYGFTRFGFADLLKKSAAALFGIEPALWDEYKKPRKAYVVLFHPTGSISLTAREFLQRYGTESHRQVFGDNFWVDYAMYSASETRDVVFTDVRFPNEAAAIHGRGGIIIQVLRDLDDSDTHASETPLPDHLIDVRLDNNGTIEDLHDAVRAMVLDGIRHARYPVAVHAKDDKEEK